MMAKHIHKYRRLKLGRKKDYYVYACSLPRCHHYIREEFIVGKESICWRCNSKFIIDVDSGQLFKPHCKECTKDYGFAQKPKAEKPKQTLDESFFEGLIPRVPKA